MKQTIMYGADPEAFATYTKNEEVYALPPVVFREDLGLETEDNGEHPIFTRLDGGYLHEDGAAFELCIPPSDNWEAVWEHCSRIITKFEDEILYELPITLVNSTLSMLPTVKWEVDRWKLRGEGFTQATRFGCNPDEDAWKEFAPPKEVNVMDASLHPYRHAGGHLHFSLPGNDEIKKRPLDVVASLAHTAGLAAIAYGNNLELEKLRAFRYGKPTKYRVQEYRNGDTGIEYRTPSASWMGDKDLAAQVFGWAEIGIRSLFLGGALEKVQKFKVETANAIMTADKAMALALLKEVGALV